MPAVPNYIAGTAPGISADRLNQPFNVKTAQYDAGNNRIRCTIGPGRVDFGGPYSGGTISGGIIEQTADAIYDIPAPALNTTYFLFLSSVGYIHDTIGHADKGVRLARLVMGGSPGDPTIVDIRGIMPVPTRNTVGVLQVATITSDVVTTPNNMVDVAGMSVSWTAKADRYYKTTLQGVFTRVIGTSGGYFISNIHVRNSAGTIIRSPRRDGYNGYGGGSQYNDRVNFVIIESGLSGSQTRKVTIDLGAPGGNTIGSSGPGGIGGHMDLQATSTDPGILMIEDAGAV